MSHPVHHLHKRKRIHHKEEAFPHPEPFKRFLDHAIYLIGIGAPLMGSTQAHKIWTEQTALGVSITMFGFNLFANIFWLTYGIVHQEKPIIIMYTLWFLVNLAIVSGIVMYG